MGRTIMSAVESCKRPQVAIGIGLGLAILLGVFGIRAWSDRTVGAVSAPKAAAASIQEPTPLRSITVIAPVTGQAVTGGEVVWIEGKLEGLPSGAMVRVRLEAEDWTVLVGAETVSDDGTFSAALTTPPDGRKRVYVRAESGGVQSVRVPMDIR
jgi:hypothetical protein